MLRFFADLRLAMNPYPHFYDGIYNIIEKIYDAWKKMTCPYQAD
jgi:hypothetical protein